MRAVTRRSIRSRSTANMPRSSGICTTCTGFSISTTATRAPTRGWRSIHVTDGDHPYMGNWWVPGLSIGYAESFVHQAADFINGLDGTPAAPTFADAHKTDLVTDAVLKSAETGQWEAP